MTTMHNVLSRSRGHDILGSEAIGIRSSSLVSGSGDWGAQTVAIASQSSTIAAWVVNPTATLLRSMQKAVGLPRRAFLGSAFVFVWWRVGGVKCKLAVSCPAEVNKMTI